MRSLTGPLHRLRRDRRGILSVEMALVLPVLVLLLVGAADVVWLTIAQDKLQRAAAAVADLTGRAAELRPADIDDLFRAAREVAAPLDFATAGRAFVSAVSNPDGTGARVVWQRATNGGLSVASRVGTSGGRADLGGALTLARGESLIVGEAFLEVRPLFGLLVNGPQRLYARTFLRPRYGSVTLLAGSADATHPPAASAVQVRAPAGGASKAPVAVPAASPVTPVAPAVVTPPLPAKIRD